MDKFTELYKTRNQNVIASYDNLKNNELNFKNILSVAGKLKYINLLFGVNNENFCKCCLGINSKIKNNVVVNYKCSCKGHEHGTFNMDEVLQNANDKIESRFKVNKNNYDNIDNKSENEKEEEIINNEDGEISEPEPYGNENYIIYSYDHFNKSNEASTESIYKRLFNNIFKIDQSEDKLDNINVDENNDGGINNMILMEFYK